MQDKERQRDDGGNAHHGFTRIYEPVTARRTESVFYDGSGFHFGACRGAEYPLRSRPHGRENAHMHLCFVPITPDNKLSAKTILGNQKSLSEWQTAYHERMSSRWNQLERGQSSMETKRKHVPTWLYKLGGRLDKQYGEIVSALSDINAFNAGKKRDKALELVAAWLPEVEKFSKEIGRQQAYIDSLKEQIGQEADYAGRMRDEKYEQELKVQKANQRIFELQRTNEQMGRLLSKIPPEVLEELQRTGRNKSRER